MRKIVLTFFICLLTYQVNAQNLSFDQVSLTDAIKRMQLMGKVDPGMSLMTSQWLNDEKNNAYKIIDTLDSHLVSYPNTVHFFNKRIALKFLPVNIVQQYVTSHPFKELDGPMVASSGYQLMATTGVYAKLGPLTIQLQPQYVHASNMDYLEVQQTPNYSKLFWGNSSIRLNLGPASLGISSENITWGPALMNPLIMSAHAPGFSHLTFNSRKPFKTPIGNFEWQWVAGYLDPMDPSFVALSDLRLNDGRYVSNTTERRFMNAGMLAWQPKWVHGLNLGLSRFVQRMESEYSKDGNWNLLFNNISRANDKDYFIETATDQYASVFLRWLWLKSNAEFYVEWGRNDAFFNLRDFIQQPEHSRGYTYGFRKLFGTDFTTSTPNKYWQFISEYTRLQQPSTWPVRSAGSWYVHGTVYPGYTNNGEILGAPIGSGGNYQMVRISHFKGLKQLGFQLERTTQNAENFEGSYLALTDPSKTKWVDLAVRVLYDYPFKHFLLSSKLIAKRSYNYNWTAPSTTSNGIQGQYNDLNSLLIQFGFRFY